MDDYRKGSSSLSYYNILGVSSDSSIDEIRRAYRKLAMQWHPDRWTRTPSLLSEAKCNFQKIQEAYSVLSDPKKRTMYDAGLYDPQEEEDEEFSDFVDEMVSLMAEVRREEKVYGLEELQAMFMEMAEGFESPPMYYGTTSIINESSCSNRGSVLTQ
ncbi:chaperone DnaJ-domain superfamily protein [Trifolium repens]|nr:chaperone DnaJ-domain superfamily protein [Trifolium repens]